MQGLVMNIISELVLLWLRGYTTCHETDNLHWQQTIHLETTHTHSSDLNPDYNPGSTYLRGWVL